MAWLLRNQLEPSSNFETIAYIGPFDPRYFIVVIAAIKVGYKAFLPSPRNSKVAQLSLLSKLECTKLVTVEPQPPAIGAVLEEVPYTVIGIPSLEELLNGNENDAPPDYPYEKSYGEAKDEPIFTLHTSGSTGIPKPLIYTHRFVTRTVNLTSLPAPEGFSSGNDTIRSGHWFTFLAPFHISGIGFGLMVSAYNDCKIYASRLASTVYLSSISGVSNYHETSGANINFVREQIITDTKCPAGMGYGQSKYVAERILDYASKNLNLANIRVARVGQIAGTSTPEQGPPLGWNRHEWLPSLVISSHYVKAMPESLGYKGDGSNAGVLDRIEWVPIDQLAILLLEISFGTEAHSLESKGAQIFHPVNPNWVSWQSLIPTVVETLEQSSSSRSSISVLKYEEWLALLQLSVNSTDALSDDPAVKLLNFFESLTVNTNEEKPLAIQRSVKMCPSLQSLDAIQVEWLRGWIKDWVLGSDNA